MFIDTTNKILSNLKHSKEQSSNDNAIADKLKGSLYAFLKYFWDLVSSENYVDNWHVKLICDVIQKEGERIKDRKPKVHDAIIINVPPGTTKTTIVLIMFPAWLWSIDPTIKVISASHSIGLSTKSSVASRDIIESDKYMRLFPKVKIKDDYNRQKEYKTNRNGSRQATSPDSKITGDHAHILLYDDLVDPQSAESGKKLPTVIKWLDRTISTREVDKNLTSQIMIMQRLGIGDPAEHMIKTRKGVFHIKLPALDTGDVKPPYLRGKYVDGLFDPVRLPIKEIENKKSIMTPNDFNAQFMQDTETATGKIFKKEYFEIIEPFDLPASFWVDSIMYFFTDSAQTDKKENDPTGCLVATLYNGSLYLVDYYSGYMAFSMLIDKLREIYLKHATHESVMFIEPKSNGKDIVDYFQVHTTFNVVEWDMLRGGKKERANVVEPSVRSKKVKVIRGEWTNDFLRVLYNFPDTSIIHDEQVDVFVMAAAEAYLEGREFVRNIKSVNF